MLRQGLFVCLSVSVLGWTAQSGVAQAPPPVADPELVPSDPEGIPTPPPVVTPAPLPRATLGVQLQSVNELALGQGTYIAREGARIASILPGSPADRVGLPLGGVIVAIDGKKVSSPADAARIMQSLPPEAKIELKYYDGNRLFRKTVQLAPTEGGMSAVPAEIPDVDAPPPPRGRQLPSERRRVLDGIGRIIDEFVPPGAIPPGVPFGPSVESDRLAQLAVQVESLQQQIRELQRKLAELEKRLPASQPH